MRKGHLFLSHTLSLRSFTWHAIPRADRWREGRQRTLLPPSSRSRCLSRQNRPVRSLLSHHIIPAPNASECQGLQHQSRPSLTYSSFRLGGFVTGPKVSAVDALSVASRGTRRLPGLPQFPHGFCGLVTVGLLAKFRASIVTCFSLAFRPAHCPCPVKVGNSEWPGRLQSGCPAKPAIHHETQGGRHVFWACFWASFWHPRGFSKF